MTLKSWVIAGKKLAVPPQRRPQLTPPSSVCLTSCPETILSGKRSAHLCCAFPTGVVAVSLNWCLYPMLGCFALWSRGQGWLGFLGSFGWQQLSTDMLTDDCELDASFRWKRCFGLSEMVCGWHFLLCCYVMEIVYLQSEAELYDLSVSQSFSFQNF